MLMVTVRSPDSIVLCILHSMRKCVCEHMGRPTRVVTGRAHIATKHAEPHHAMHDQEGRGGRYSRREMYVQ